jgi:predicted RNA-binding protein with PIN domain
MRTLIDGYNLMYALGLLGERLGPDRFRKARTRFLNTLADALGAVEAHQTTVVFDASVPLAHLPSQTSHRGITIVYAVDDDDADTRIEHLIAEHPAPKLLAVVSSDHRIRQAAARRKAEALTTDAFLDRLDAARTRRPDPVPVLSSEERARHTGLSPAETALWLEVFRDVQDEPDAEEALGLGGFIPSDEEIARIEREVENEF